MELKTGKELQKTIADKWKQEQFEELIGAPCWLVKDLYGREVTVSKGSENHVYDYDSYAEFFAAQLATAVKYGKTTEYVQSMDYSNLQEYFEWLIEATPDDLQDDLIYFEAIDMEEA